MYLDQLLKFIKQTHGYALRAPTHLEYEELGLTMVGSTQHEYRNLDGDIYRIVNGIVQLNGQNDWRSMHGAMLFFYASNKHNTVYMPRIDDRAKILEIAYTTINTSIRREVFLSYLINKYNFRYGAKNTRIYLKDLPSSWSLQYNPTLTRKFLYNNNSYRISYGDTSALMAAQALFRVMGTADENIVLNKILTNTSIIAELDTAPCEVLQYSSKVERYIKSDTPKGEVRFGIELELEDNNPTRLIAAHNILKKHCIFKRDGSLNNGVEIVSKPDTIANHKQMFKAFFDANIGYVARDNCGIHIHASRGSMSFLQMGRIHAFMNTNRDRIQKIAGRSSTYAKFGDESVLTPWYKAQDKYQDKKQFNWDKYTAVNLAPSETMEFRIFKSTTKWEEFCRFLEFPEAVISYCALAGNDNKGKIRGLKDLLTFSNFVDFVKERGSVYKDLNKFMQKEFA